jgi:protein transport protein SEC24
MRRPCSHPSRAQAAYRTISHIGGKLMLFTAAASTLAAAPTKNRDAPAHYNSDREAALRNPADPFYNQFASECIAAQICVDVFAASSQYLDLFSLAALPRSTGGTVYFYPGFSAPRDAVKLSAELSHNLLRPTGWEAVMRLRCSKGMRVSTFHGHLFVRSNDLVALPSVSADDTVVAQLQMEDTMVAGARVYVQCAVLYTNSSSERRIRVHTLSLPVVGSVFDMFEAADGLACAGAPPSSFSCQKKEKKLSLPAFPARQQGSAMHRRVEARVAPGTG